MEQKLKARSVNRKLSAVKSFFRYLKKNEVIARNPAEAVAGPKASKRLPSFVNDREMTQVIDDSLIIPMIFAGIATGSLLNCYILPGCGVPS